MMKETSTDTPLSCLQPELDAVDRIKHGGMLVRRTAYKDMLFTTQAEKSFTRTVGLFFFLFLFFFFFFPF